MDILEEYKKQNPQVSEMKGLFQGMPSGGYGRVGRMLVRLSGGRISDAQAVNKTLLVISILALGGAAIVFVASLSLSEEFPEEFSSAEEFLKN